MSETIHVKLGKDLVAKTHELGICASRVCRMAIKEKVERLEKLEREDQERKNAGAGLQAQTPVALVGCDQSSPVTDKNVSDGVKE